MGSRGTFRYIPRCSSRVVAEHYTIFRDSHSWEIVEYSTIFRDEGLAENTIVSGYSAIFRDGRLGKLPVSRDIPLYSATERLVRKTKNPRPARPPSGGDTDQLLRPRATLGQQTARKRWSFRADNPDSSTDVCPLTGEHSPLSWLLVSFRTGCEKGWGLCPEIQRTGVRPTRLCLEGEGAPL